MDSIFHDLRYAFRRLGRSPGFSVVAALTLAIGIGANTALFSLANAVFVRPLPAVHDQSRLVWITPVYAPTGRPTQMPYTDFLEFRNQSVFESAAAFGNAEFSLSGGAEPVRVRGQVVSGSLFTLLGVHMQLGRGFAPDEDDKPATAPVVVISDRLWRERFNADSSVIGRRIVLDGLAFAIVGVAPPGFCGADLDDTERAVWVPLAMQPRVMPDLPLDDRNAWWLAAVGKLKPGVSRGQARAAVATVSARLAKDDSARHSNISVSLVRMRGGIQPKDARQIAPVGFLAAGATGLILLICCANVGNMLLSRAVRRRHEIAVRLSMGATRSRVVRQLLTESVLLATAASVLGLILALWATEALTAAILPTADVSPDWHTISFAAFAALATGLLFGLAPALHATRGALASTLKDSVASLDRRRSGLQNTLVVAQVSLSLVLLATSGMFLDSLYRATQAPLGFEASSHVLAASFDLSMQGYSPERADAFVATLSRQAAALPGVSNVSATSVVPLGNRRAGAEIALDPSDGEAATSFTGRGADGYVNVVRRGFFHTLGIALVAGRDFEATDNLSSPGVAIVSEDFARGAWPGANPLGKHISVRGEHGPFMTVIGVARTALTFGLGERLRPIVYRPASQAPDERDMTLLVRSPGDATQLASAIRAAVRSLDPNLPIYAMQSLGAYRRARLSDMALGSSLLGGIGALAMLLATIGIYAVVAFSVGQRVREIGLRVALGAAGGDVTSLFLRHGARLTALGLGIGLALAGIAGRAVSTQFLGVSVMDAATFAIVATLLGGVALVATWIPARRAAAVDPMIALRTE